MGEEVNPRSGQKTANRLGRGRAAGSGSASSPRTGRASGSTGVWDPGHQSKGGMDGPPEVALSLRPGPCRSRAGWDLRRQRCGSQSGAVGSQSGAERQRQKRKEPAFHRRSSPSSRSSPLLLLSSPLPRTQLPGRWAWGRLLTRLISLTAASRPAQALRSQVQELFNL